MVECEEAPLSIGSIWLQCLPQLFGFVSYTRTPLALRFGRTSARRSLLRQLTTSVAPLPVAVNCTCRQGLMRSDVGFAHLPSAILNSPCREITPSTSCEMHVVNLPAEPALCPNACYGSTIESSRPIIGCTGAFIRGDHSPGHRLGDTMVSTTGSTLDGAV